MDDIIVIIIMVALTIIGAVSRSKKKKTVVANTNSPTPKPKVSDFWETLFEDNQAETEEISIEESKMYTQEPIMVTEPKQYTASQLFEEGSPVKKDKILQDVIKKNEIGNSGKQKEILEGFSLKKAIVFSEIINQKYF